MKKNYKPKATRTLRKMIFDMKEHCENVSKSEYFGCHTCPFNVFLKTGSAGCYFEHSGGERPCDWELNKMGSYVE